MVDRKNHRVKRRHSGLSAALVSPQRQRKICRFVKGVIFSRDPRLVLKANARPCKILRGRAYHFCIIRFKGSLRKILSGQPLLAKVIHMPQPAKNFAGCGRIAVTRQDIFGQAKNFFEFS